jgi:hypothetical protein
MLFYHCPQCGDRHDKCSHHEHEQPVKLTACPFCEGPPVPFATSERFGFAFEADGSMVDAYVFCHECGAQGPSVEGLCWDDEDVAPLIDRAVLLWETKNNRHRELYDAGDAEGLNLHPRASADTNNLLQTS